jgi:selenocysteine lyase/cysteine desulfurase
MGVTRKELLAGGAALALAGCGSKRPAAATTTPSPKGWAAVRAQFALDPADRHFDGFLFAAHPKPVRDAIERHRKGLDSGANEYLHAHQEEAEKAVATNAAGYLGANPSELAFTDSTTMGLAMVYRGLLKPGDEVVTTEHDHYATHESLRLTGAKVRKIALYDDPSQATADDMIGALKAGVTPRTKAIAVTWVHSGTGVKLPVAKLAQALGPNRPLLVVDGVHALGVEPDPVDNTLCDILVAGTHKWLGGPRGTGLIWSIKGWEQLTPVIPTFSMSPDPGPHFTPGGYHSFEHRWALAEAFDWQATLGRAKVADRIHALAQRLKDGLAELSHVRLVTPRASEVSSGIVCFEVDGVEPGQVVARLKGMHIRASVTPYAVEYARLGTSLHVDEEDVDAAVQSVATLG